MKKDFHVFFLFTLFLLFAVNSAWAADVTLQTAADGTKYVYMPDKGKDNLTIPASDIDNGLKTFKVYATLGAWEDYKNSRVLEISVPEGYFIGADYSLNSGHTGINHVNIRNGYLVGNGSHSSTGLPAAKNTLQLSLLGYKDAIVLEFDMTVYIQAPRSISLNSVGVEGSASFINKTVAKRISWEQDRTLEGDLITVTAVPKKGYFFKGLEIKKGNEILNDVSVGDVEWYSDPTKNIVQFIMPDADIEITPIFTKKITADNGFFIKLYGSKDITIPDGVESFKVYDEGGKDGAYPSGGGELHLTNSSGKLFMVTGTIQTDGDKANTYLHIYDGESWYKSSTKIAKYSEIAGKSTDIGTFVSSDNRLNIGFYARGNPQSYDGVDLTVKLLSSLTSLGEDSQLDYKEISRTDPPTIYTTFTNDENSIEYYLETRHDVGSGWSDWAYLGDEGKVLKNQNNKRSFKVPSALLRNRYEYIEFRYKCWDLDDNLKRVGDPYYTSSVKVRLMNKVYVDAKVGNTSLDYTLTNTYGVVMDKNRLLPNGTEVKVQALAPAGYKFDKWVNGNGSEVDRVNPITLTVVSDTSLRANFSSTNLDDVRLSVFISKNGDDSWTSAEDSPLEVNVTKPKQFAVKASVVGREDLCGVQCYAYVVMRKVGSDKWDTLGPGIRAAGGNSYTASGARGPDDYTKGDVMSGAGRFEIKAVVTKKKDGVILGVVESNSVFANLFHTLSMWNDCVNIDQSTDDNGCSAVVEDEFGGLHELNSEKSLIFQYGAKVKLHPQYAYNREFASWKNANSLPSLSELKDPDIYLSKDEFYEFSMAADQKLSLAIKSRTPDIVRIRPENAVMPYAGMTDFGLTLGMEGKNGNVLDFASDTAFYIEKEGLTDKFAVNKLDSMFTPGNYTLVVKLVDVGHNESKRDSLWACEGSVLGRLVEQQNSVGKNGDFTKCSENSPATRRYRFDFAVNDTTFNVVFNTWDDENGQYVTVGGTQKVAFGEVPTVPDEIKCPESNTAWNFTCDWASPLVAAVKDASYNFNVVRSNSAVAVSVEDGFKTATIEGAYDGNEALKITEATTVDNVELNREFSTSGKGFSTIVLPFDFNAAALSGVKSVIKFNRMTKNNNGNPAVGMAYVWCDAEVQESLKEQAKNTEDPNKYDHCNNGDKTNFPGDMEAYTPYMVQMEDTQIGFDYVGGVTLEKTPDEDVILVSKETDDGTWEFRGTTKKKVWDAEETKDGYIWGFAAQIKGPANYVGKFVQLGEGASAPPLRAYMVFKPKNSNPSAQLVAPRNASFAARPAKALGAEMASLPDEIDVVIESQGSDGEEHRTVIGTFTRSTGEFKMLRDYDLKGRKVNGVNKARGAYYGKKVLKK